MPESAQKKRVDLVFEGGGVKGIALVGALTVLEEWGYEPQGVAGTSAGAVLAALLAAGYTAARNCVSSFWRWTSRACRIEPGRIAYPFWERP